jgi:hypothetical protein
MFSFKQGHVERKGAIQEQYDDAVKAATDTVVRWHAARQIQTVTRRFTRRMRGGRGGGTGGGTGGGGSQGGSPRAGVRKKKMVGGRTGNVAGNGGNTGSKGVMQRRPKSAPRVRNTSTVKTVNAMGGRRNDAVTGRAGGGGGGGGDGTSNYVNGVNGGQKRRPKSAPRRRIRRPIVGGKGSGGGGVGGGRSTHCVAVDAVGAVDTDVEKERVGVGAETRRKGRGNPEEGGDESGGGDGANDDDDGDMALMGSGPVSRQTYMQMVKEGASSHLDGAADSPLGVRSPAVSAGGDKLSYVSDNEFTRRLLESHAASLAGASLAGGHGPTGAAVGGGGQRGGQRGGQHGQHGQQGGSRVGTRLASEEAAAMVAATVNTRGGGRPGGQGGGNKGTRRSTGTGKVSGKASARPQSAPRTRADQARLQARQGRLSPPAGGGGTHTTGNTNGQSSPGNGTTARSTLRPRSAPRIRSRPPGGQAGGAGGGSGVVTGGGSGGGLVGGSGRSGRHHSPSSSPPRGRRRRSPSPSSAVSTGYGKISPPVGPRHSSTPTSISSLFGRQGKGNNSGGGGNSGSGVTAKRRPQSAPRTRPFVRRPLDYSAASPTSASAASAASPASAVPHSGGKRRPKSAPRVRGSSPWRDGKSRTNKQRLENQRSSGYGQYHIYI